MQMELVTIYTVISNFDSNRSAKKQNPEKERIYICGLGAKVECERLSEHSTCSDESHKYRFFPSLGSSVFRLSSFY